MGVRATQDADVQPIRMTAVIQSSIAATITVAS